MPAGIPVDFAKVRHKRFNVPVEPTPSLLVQLLLQVAVLLRELIKKRTDRMQRSALSDIEQIGAVVLLVFPCQITVSHRRDLA